MRRKTEQARKQVDLGEIFVRMSKRMIRPFVVGLICLIILLVSASRKDEEWEVILAGAVALLWITVFGVLITGALMVAQRLAARRVGGESGRAANAKAWKRALGMTMAGSGAVSMAISGGLAVLAGAILRSRNAEVASIIGTILFWFGFVHLGLAFFSAIWFVGTLLSAKARRKSLGQSSSESESADREGGNGTME